MQDDLATRIEKIRQALRHGGQVVGQGKPPMPVTGPLAVVLAQMVHAYDLSVWESGGKQGDEPNLLRLLHECRTNGTHLSEQGWVEMIGHHPELESLRDELQRQIIEADVKESRPTVLPDMKAHKEYQPRDVARLRRDIAEWLTRKGTGYYQDAIDDGRQSIYVADSPLPAAQALAMTEVDALHKADLYYIDLDMCQLLAAAHPSMPAFAPMRSDLPSDYGFAVFAAPLSHHHNRPFNNTPLAIIDRDGQHVDVTAQLSEEGTQVIAVTWRPYVNPPRARWWRAGGVWMTFYAIPVTHVLASRGGPGADLFKLAAADLAELLPENEMCMGWYDPALEMDEADFVLKDRKGTAVWLGAVIAAFQLARQANLAETVVERIPGRMLPKSVARRTGQRTRPPQEIRVIRLRQQVRAARDAEAPADADARKGREYRHRWVVRGFWRNTWYSKSQVHRPQWIAPYLKGPAGAPLLGGEKVTVVSPPPAPQKDTP